jgi:hypothetical protein|tara:strand:- start:258 stop:602 length:345 start_codon:yes stop_codon:yes gene_type:complete
MSKENIEFRDPVVKRVVNKFVDRSNLGFEKYGRTLDSERTNGHKDLFGYLNDVQEELMDAILYLQSAREELSDLAEDAQLERMNVVAQNGNDGEHYSAGPCTCHDKATEDAEAL